MRNEEKIRKQNSLLWFQHEIWSGLLGLVAVIVLIQVFGTSFSAVVGVFLGYRIFDRYVVYDITEGYSGLIYRLINLRTRKFGQCDLIRPLSEKFGIGYYYDDVNPQFMDAFEVVILRDEAEKPKNRNRKNIKSIRNERNEQLEAIGRERLKS